MSGSKPLALPFLGLSIAAVAVAIVQAARHSWTTDDAYISFRYARNLLDGLGLVYNAGERVEGYSNFLWTLWAAVGMRFGYEPEKWAGISGIVCFAGSVALLCVFTLRRRGSAPGPLLPIAAVLAACHRDWSIFATSGLETSLFTALAIAGFVLLAAPGEPGRGRLVGAGLVLALAALTRPDGVLFTAIGGAYVLWIGRPRWRAALLYAAPVLLLLAPYAIWKLAFYGDLIPNTYYAKSAQLSWFSQGGIYVALYFQKYWVLPLGLLLAGGAAVAGWRRRDDDDDGRDRDWTRAAALAAAFALAYTFVIARVGGDFMFARLLIPATPFFLILFELGLERIAVRRAAVRGAIAAVALAGMIVTPVPVGGDEWKSGVADEWKYYQRRDRDSLEASCGRLRTMFRGLPIRAAFVGTEALIAYCSEVPLAIEATTGLTDSFIAHQPLTKRGRPGHEKNAPFSYLIDQRKAHFILVPAGYVVDTLAPYVPVIDVKFAGLPAAVLNWDEPLMRELVRRGAEVMDFLPTLDWYIRAMPTMSDSAVRADYTKLRRYYFDDANDPARERPFLERLGRSK